MKRTAAAVIAALFATPAFAGSLSIDSFFRDSRGRLQVYLTVTPDRPYARHVSARCYLLSHGTPFDDNIAIAKDVTGPTRLSMTFYDQTTPNPEIECRAEFL